MATISSKVMLYSIFVILVSTLFNAPVYAEGAGCSPKPGSDKSRWEIKTSVVNPIDNPTSVSLHYLMNLDNPLVDAHMRNQMRTGRLAKQHGAKVKEGDIVITEGYLQAAHCSGDDDDYHLEVATSPGSKLCFIVEIPNGKYMKSPYSKMADKQREAVRKMFGGNKPTGTLDTPIKVKIMGGLFYDSQHYSKKKPQGGGRRGTHHCATNLWEIHPVLSIAPVE